MRITSSCYFTPLPAWREKSIESKRSIHFSLALLPGTSNLMAQDYTKIPPFVAGKRRIYAVIETPAFTRHKYAYDSQFEVMKLHLTLPEGLEWPYDYGFVPGTLAEDGDPIDVLLLNDASTFTGCLVEARLLGVIKIKKNGVENDRLIARPPRRKGVALSTDDYKDIDDVPKATLRGIERFLVEYSEEAGNKIDYGGTGNREQAFAMLEKGVKAFEKRE